MAKRRTVYVCQSCGAHHPQWHGRCSDCGEWESLLEEAVAVKTGSKSIAGVVEDWSFSRPFDESKLVKPPEARVDESNRERRKH